MLQLKQTLINLSVNCTYSSSTIAQQSMQAISEFLIRQGGFTASNWGETLLNSINKLISDHPNIFKLYHYLNHILLLVQTKQKSQLTSTELLSHINKYEKQWKSVENQILDNFIDTIDLNNKTILLHGDNILVQNLFSKLASLGIKPSIYQTVSRPTAEGKNQAKILSSLGFHVNYIEDVTVGKFLSLIDLTLTGADGIRSNHFINKAGTLMIGLACKRFGIPYYVISDTRSILNEQECAPELIRKLTAEPPKNADGMWQFPPGGVHPISYYYDTTPNDTVKKFIFELGAYNQQDLKDLNVSFPVSSLIDLKT